MISKDGGEVKTVVELDLKEFYDDTTDTSYFEENKKAIHDAVSIGFVSKLQIFSFQTPIAYYFLLEFQCYFGDDESKVTQDLVNKCNTVCKPRFCCFDNYKLESSCRWTLGDEECELFSPCKKLITKEGGIVKTYLELDLQEFSENNDKSSIDVNIEEQVYKAVSFMLRFLELKSKSNNIDK